MQIKPLYSHNITGGNMHRTMGEISELFLSYTSELSIVGLYLKVSDVLPMEQHCVLTFLSHGDWPSRNIVKALEHA